MSEYADREKQFDASLGNVMGGWMLDVAKADLARQQGWLEAIQVLTTPDKTGKIPEIVSVVWYHRELTASRCPGPISRSRSRWRSWVSS